MAIFYLQITMGDLLNFSKFSHGFAIVFSLIYFSAYAQNALVQPYLQLASPISVYVKWETDVDTQSLIQYGLTESLGNSFYGSTTTTNNSTILHETNIKGLTPNTTYFYKAVTGSWESGIRSFTTQPTRDSEASFNIVLMSDMQKDGANPNIFNDLVNTSLLPYIDTAYGSPLSEHVQMAMIPGDLVANGNSYNQWKNDFFDPGQELWRSVPIYPALGNHEVNSSNYFNYFTLPENGTPGYLEHWYYHDYSNVRVLSLDSNSPYRLQAQLNWLDSILTLSCSDTLIDFVFAELHHPYKSELWTPGNTNYTGDVIELLEAFSSSCDKPSIHFFGHTHAYSRGQSRDHDHLWVNVATGGGRIDSWGEYPNEDYEEFILSQDEYGFVMVEVTAGDDPQFVIKRLSFGDASNPGGSTETDFVTVRKNNTAPNTPYPIFPAYADTVSAFCFTMKADGFDDPDGHEHGASHWQISTDSIDFSNPVEESWKQYANWYYEVNLQAEDDLTDEEVTGLEGNSSFYWRVRYRDKSLTWSNWSVPTKFHTSSLDTLTTNLVLNNGAEDGISNWTATIGVIESLGPGECAGGIPYVGNKYFGLGALCVDNPFGSAYQDQDIAAFAATVDSGLVLVHFGAYMADYNNSDQPAMALLFLDESNAVISSTDTVRHQLVAWTKKELVASIPISTRSIRTTLMGKRNAGADNDSYIDSVFCQLMSGEITCSDYSSPGPINGRIYVDKDAVAFPDGKSWLTAYRDLGSALEQSNEDTNIQSIWIADGSYRVTTTSERDTSFTIQRGVSIYGGFEGNETSLSERDVMEHTTILTGNIGDTSLLADNVYHVIRIQNNTDSIRLDGLQICCGYADGLIDTTGAGLYISSSSLGPITLYQCQIENNFAHEGSSIYNEANASIFNSSIHSEINETFFGCSILNAGAFAHLRLVNTTVTHLCDSCPEVIRNLNNALLTVEESVVIEKE